MATIQSTFLSEAQDVVARYRRAGGILSEDQAVQMEKEVERALIAAWANQRVHQMVNAQLDGPLTSIQRVLDRILSDENGAPKK